MDAIRNLLQRTAEHAAAFLETLDERPVFPQVTVEQLRTELGGRLPEHPTDPTVVIDQLVAGAEPGAVTIPSGRYFRFVLGGAVPAARAADWLTSAWDQTAGLYVIGPPASVGEAVPRASVRELLTLPAE